MIFNRGDTRKDGAILIRKVVKDVLLSNSGQWIPIYLASDIVILATRWEQAPTVVQGASSWNGKIVIDTTNNHFGPGVNDLYDLGGLTSSEVVAALVPGARIVKAFNHQPISELAPLADSVYGAKRKALFVTGDNADAKRVVAQIIRDIGGEPIDTGGLRDGGRLQGTEGPLAGYGRLLTVSEAQQLLAKLRKLDFVNSDKIDAADMKI